MFDSENTKIPISKFIFGKSIIDETVGFNFVPDIVRTRSITEGFNLNILAVGRRGLGTCTLLNSLFDCPLVDKNRENDIFTTTNEIYENDICLTVTTTTYHGENLDVVLDFIDEKNLKYFEVEQSFVKRSDSFDPRIHLCIYMLPSDNLTQSELSFMHDLSKKVNLLPIISKADSFTKNELRERKKKIKSLLSLNKINIYHYNLAYDEDPEFAIEVKKTTDSYPLAVIASIDIFEQNGQVIKGRLYPWCFLSIEDERISDFKKLRRLIIQNHFDDLVFKTDTVFYNDFRKMMLKKENSDSIFKRNRILRLKIEMEKIHAERHLYRMTKLENELANLTINQKLVRRKSIKK